MAGSQSEQLVSEFKAIVDSRIRYEPKSGLQRLAKLRNNRSTVTEGYGNVGFVRGRSGMMRPAVIPSGEGMHRAFIENNRYIVMPALGDTAVGATFGDKLRFDHGNVAIVAYDSEPDSLVRSWFFKGPTGSGIGVQRRLDTLADLRAAVDVAQSMSFNKEAAEPLLALSEAEQSDYDTDHNMHIASRATIAREMQAMRSSGFDFEVGFVQHFSEG